VILLARTKALSYIFGKIHIHCIRIREKKKEKAQKKTTVYGFYERQVIYYVEKKKNHMTIEGSETCYLEHSKYKNCEIVWGNIINY